MACATDRAIESMLRNYNRLNFERENTVELHRMISAETYEPVYAISEWDADKAIRVAVARNLSLDELISMIKIMQPDHPMLR